MKKTIAIIKLHAKVAGTNLTTFEFFLRENNNVVAKSNLIILIARGYYG